MPETLSPSPRRFADLRRPEVPLRCSARSLLLQPVAGVSQQGPHLPLSTDLILTSAIVDAVLGQRGAELDLWGLPLLPYGKTNEHAWAAGTIWLSSTTLLAVLDDLGRAVAATPIRRLVFINGHGGNSSLLEVACRDLRLRYGLLTFLLHPAMPPDHGGTGGETAEGSLGIHAGHKKTSLMLYLRPDLVEMGAAERRMPEWLGRYEQVGFGGPARFAWLSNDFGPSGVIGDPTTASAAAGEQLFRAMVATLGAQLAEVSRFAFETSAGDR